MKRSFLRLLCLAGSLSLGFSLCPGVLIAQSGNQGTITVTVTDTTGAVIPTTDLELVELRSNSVRKAKTTGAGTYSFVNLNIGSYRLTATHAGYQTSIFDNVVVQAATVTGLDAKLPVGAVTETVRVSAESSPVLETESNAIGTVVDLKQIENLPLSDRNLGGFISLTAGYNGTFNGLPSPDQGTNVDGTVGAPNRMKFSGSTSPSVVPRLEAVEQMSIQTDQLGLNSGFGTSTTQVSYVSRRGSNRFHGRLFEDFRNSWLNANTWTNNMSGAKRPHQVLNDFGGSVGGPILHDKLFFFGSFATQRLPGTNTATNSVFTPGAQNGNFTYTNGSTTNTVNVLNIANNYQAGLGTPNPTVAAQIALINKNIQGNPLSAVSDPNLQTVTWLQANPQTRYYPAVRFDYNLNEKVRFYLSVLYIQDTRPSTASALFPGDDFVGTRNGTFSRSFTNSFGYDHIITPTLINQLKLGYLYNYGQNPAFTNNDYTTKPYVNWNMTNQLRNMSGQTPASPISTLYPVFNVSDTLTWQHGTHNVTFGASWMREQDHYWNAPYGYPTVNLGLNGADPATGAFTITGNNAALPGATTAQQAEAEQLYAILAGRVSSVSGMFNYDQKTQAYNYNLSVYALDELQTNSGVSVQDSWKAFPTLTLNYGILWSFNGDNHDLTGAYHNSTPGDIYGPSGNGNLFQPGNLPGNMNPVLSASSHKYNPYYVTPQPAFGLAWNPHGESGFLKKVLGGDNTVVRAGFALRRFLEPQQFFWDFATDYGNIYYDKFSLTANSSGSQGTFAPGSLKLQPGTPALGSSTPSYGGYAYALQPPTYAAQLPQSIFTMKGNNVPVGGLDPNIKQPYTESWNFGIQRAIGRGMVVEARYNGNRSLHNWVTLNPNEVNIFENGFLNEFKNAQSNYAINHAAGKESFSDVGLTRTPTIDAAFGGQGTSTYNADVTNTTYLNYIKTGAAGSLAALLARGDTGNTSFYCNLVGAKNFGPCVTSVNSTAPGAGYPLNFFQANPYATGYATSYMTAAGSSNYNALQLEVRQQNWKGLQYNVNYTWSHSLGVGTPNSYDATFTNFYTLRDFRSAYGPTLYDLQQVTHANFTYDLPFGRGKTFSVSNRLLDAVVGGWNVGSIIKFQTGFPFKLTGGYSTFNTTGDGGVVLNGITTDQLQKSVGIHRVPGKTTVLAIDPNLVSGSAGANPTYLTPNTTPGTFGRIVYIHGPHSFGQDVAISKSVPIKEGINFKLQSEFLNAWNHPTFGFSSGNFNSSLLSSSFFQASETSSVSIASAASYGRVIELRANIEF